MIVIVSCDDFMVWPFHLLKIVVFETPSASEFLLTYLGVGIIVLWNHIKESIWLLSYVLK